MSHILLGIQKQLQGVEGGWGSLLIWWWWTLLRVRVQELCDSWGSHPGLSVLMNLTVSVDVKQHWTMLKHWSQFVPNMSTTIWGHETLLHHHPAESDEYSWYNWFPCLRFSHSCLWNPGPNPPPPSPPQHPAWKISLSVSGSMFLLSLTTLPFSDSLHSKFHLIWSTSYSGSHHANPVL